MELLPAPGSQESHTQHEGALDVAAKGSPAARSHGEALWPRQRKQGKDFTFFVYELMGQDNLIWVYSLKLPCQKTKSEFERFP